MGKNSNEFQKSVDHIKQIFQRIRDDHVAYKARHLPALFLAIPLSVMAISSDLLQKLFTTLIGLNDLAPQRVKFLNGAFKAFLYLSGALVLLALQPAAMLKALLENLNEKVTFPVSKRGVREREQGSIVKRLAEDTGNEYPEYPEEGGPQDALRSRFSQSEGQSSRVTVTSRGDGG